jgi:hypothetical protein
MHSWSRAASPGAGLPDEVVDELDEVLDEVVDDAFRDDELPARAIGPPYPLTHAPRQAPGRIGLFPSAGSAGVEWAISSASSGCSRPARNTPVAGSTRATAVDGDHGAPTTAYFVHST